MWESDLLVADAKLAADGHRAVELFEEWDAWIGQTFLYADRELAPGYFSDVRELLAEAATSDPEREATADLFEALYSEFGDRPVAARSAMPWEANVCPMKQAS